jgi:hypothetical protein
MYGIQKFEPVVVVVVVTVAQNCEHGRKMYADIRNISFVWKITKVPK